jgi:hypothetical protein
MRGVTFTATFLRTRTIHDDDLARGYENVHQFRLNDGQLWETRSTKLIQYACTVSGRLYEIEIGPNQWPINILDIETGTGFSKKSNSIMKYTNGEEPVNLSRKNSFRLNLKK